MEFSRHRSSPDFLRSQDVSHQSQEQQIQGGSRKCKHRTLPNVIGPGCIGASDWHLGNLDTCEPRRIGRSNYSQMQRMASVSGGNSGDERSVSVTSRSRAYDRDSPVKCRDPRRLSRARHSDSQARKEREEEFIRSSSIEKAESRPTNSPRESCFSRASSMSVVKTPSKQWRSSSCTRLSSTISTLEAALLPSTLAPTIPEQRPASSTAVRQRKSFTRMPLMPYESLPTPKGRFAPAAPTKWFPHPSACLPPGAGSQDFLTIFVENPY